MLGQRPLSVLPVVYRIWASTRMGQLGEWFRSWVPDSVFSAGGGRGSVEAWYTSSLDIEEVLAGATDSHVHLFVADIVKSFDTVDRTILDCVLSSLGLPGWFRHAYFEFHAHVRMRFKLASGIGAPWTRDGGIPQGCPLSMMFIVALYLPWCRYLSAQVVVQPQLYADNLKCVSRDPDSLLAAARFTTGYVRLVGQEPAPSKCVLLSTSREVRHSMKGWLLSREGDRWSVRFDVRDLGGHLDTTFRGWSSTLAARVRLVLSRLVLIFALPLDFHGRSVLLGLCIYLLHFMVLRPLCSLLIAYASFVPLFLVLFGPVVNPVLMLVLFLACLMGPRGVTHVFVWLGFVFVCFVGIWLFGLLRWVGFIVFWGWLVKDALGMVLSIFFLPVLLRLGFSGILVSLIGFGLVFLLLAIWLVWCSILKVLFLKLGVIRSLRDLCCRKGFRGGPLLDVHGSLQLLTSSHVRERDKALLGSIMVGGVWNGFLLGRVRSQFVPCRFCGAPDGDGHLFWECTFPPLVEIRENPEFHDLIRMDKVHWPRCLLWHGWLPRLYGVKGASPWAVDAAGCAGYLVESALGRYSSGLLAAWSLPFDFDAVKASSLLPDHPNVLD